MTLVMQFYTIYFYEFLWSHKKQVNKEWQSMFNVQKLLFQEM